MIHINQSKINHVALVIDASFSMDKHQKAVIAVADGLIKHLAAKSQELDQETRVTVYTFGDDWRVLIFDKDVMRLPSIKDLYKIDGNTALIAATMKSQDDLAKTAQMYGDHAFLTYVITDGEENVSRWSTVFGGNGQRVRYTTTASKYTDHEIKKMLADRLNGLEENWTVACLVPNQMGVRYAESYGFPRDNIQIWDTTSKDGILEVGKVITEATDTYMTNRDLGVRGSKTMFAKMGAADLNLGAVKQAGLRRLPKDKYEVLAVLAADDGAAIKEFVERMTGKPYVTGTAHYELMKTEKIQPSKKVLVRDKKSGVVYTGQHARDLLGLPSDREVRVKTDENPKYRVFVQSTSLNRKLVAGTKLILLAS